MNELYVFQSRNKYQIPMTYAKNVYYDWENDKKEQILTAFFRSKNKKLIENNSAEESI
jgi:hypothetical protein